MIPICQHNVSTDPVYLVTVVTDPPSGPHPIGSTVNLTCLIHPQPPGGRSTYQWRDYLQYTYLAVANSSLSYAILSITNGHPHTARYYCQVYHRNQLLASGSTVITVQCRLLHACDIYICVRYSAISCCRFAISSWANYCPV